MSAITLVSRSAGQVILDTFFNDIRTCLMTDFVGRDTSGAPVSGNNLGSAAYPWGNVYANQFTVGGVAFNTQLLERPQYQIVSGKKRSGSNQPAFIQAAGSAATFSVLASSTNLLLSVAGTAVTLASDVNGIAATTAPASSNTCLVNDPTNADGTAKTRTFGEYGQGVAGGQYFPITIDSVGSEISNRVGTFQAFKANGEYFIAYIESATSLSRCFRGFFFDSSLAPVKRHVFSDDDTITLMNLGYVFADADGVTIDVIFANANASPTYSYSSPSGPVLNDYWYDLGNQVWKKYSGSAWVIVSRMLIGLVVCDSSHCVASRSLDFFGVCRQENTIEASQISNTVCKGDGENQFINVKGNLINYGSSRPVWDTASNLAASTERYNSTVQASTYEYLYVADTGETKISDMEPQWRAELYGWYHPFNPWRCVSAVYADGSAHFGAPYFRNFGALDGSRIGAKSITGTQICDSVNLGGLPGANGYGMILNGWLGLANSYVLTGKINADGTTAYGYNFTSAKNSTGNYTITFGSSFAEGPVGVVSLLLGLSTEVYGIRIISLAVGSMVVQVYEHKIGASNTTGSSLATSVSNQPFTFMVVGV